MRASLAPVADFLARHSALIALAAFAAVGLVIFDDYGVSLDEGWHRNIGRASLDYILANRDAPLADVHRFYGVAFESPLAAVERVLGLENLRDIYLSRRLLTHAFFLAGGFFAWLFAYRLFGSRLIALFAMSLFLLHPRIYAHTFFNTKDLPFLCMFMISLYLIHRAFRRDSVWAFALCGAGVGLLVNMRIMGLTLFPAVLGMLALDVFYGMKRGGGGVKHDIANICVFSTMFAAALYATWPLLWRDPLNLAEAVSALSRHPIALSTLFRGERIHWPNLPWDYVPTWILITTPPVALALAALGIWHVARLCAVRWRDALSNSTARFGLLALACLVLPIAAIIAISPNMYNGWRMTYFLYAPMCVLAAFGLRALADIPKPAIRAGAFAATALGIALVAVQMVGLHPHQSEYFTPLANRNALANNFHTDYLGVACRQGIELALSMQPQGRVSVNSEDCTQYALTRNRRMLPTDDRRRLSINRAFPDFWVGKNVENATVKREIYGFSIEAARDARSEARAAYQRLYDDARSREPLFRGRFDIRLADGFLIYLKEPCAESDVAGTFSADARPVHPDAISAYVRHAPNFARAEFDFWNYGAFVGDACLMALPLPTYPLESLALSYAPPDGEGGGAPAWSAEIPANAHLNAYARAMKSEPAARAGGFSIYADQERGALTYVKTPCGESDARGRFLLSAFPMDPRDLPESMRKGGLDYDYLDFDFHRYGGLFGDKCVIVRDLPDYPTSHLHAGQWLPEEGGGLLWSAKIVRDAAYYDRFAQALANLPAEPSARADFNVYADDRTLTYVKSPCAESDARGRFLLSIFPIDPRDLPQAARDAGAEREYANFDFRLHGEKIDGKCVIVRDLPDYPISHIETGQWTRGEGELWSAKIVLDSAYYDRYAQALANLPAEPSARADFDVYIRDRTLTYVKTHCMEEDARGRFILSAFPADQDDLPQSARDAGLEHEPLNFSFAERGAIINGKCVIIRDLPDYPMSHIETGQWTRGEGELWSARIPLDGYYDGFRRALESLSGEPAARAGGFDIYANGGELIYIREGCADADVAGRFNLSIFPADQSGPFQTARGGGAKRESLDFDFAQYGAIFDGKCVIIRDLPDYPISRIETGQRTEGERELWSAELPLEAHWQRYRDALTALSGESPAIRSDFDVYMKDGALTYVKTHCSERDARGRFFLSVFPADPRDLPQIARAAGREHESLNFDFLQGAIFEGKCVIVRDLPDYRIDRIETGQWTDGEGNLWSGMIEVGD